ncbi:high-affinity branched-chain amino acid ABC transporter permease LivM [Sneathiella sp. P13V-1]|uniref:high-affinity branched-chain amino acid ABC transporter permease LivM n=1 Tax=Sneathiella sp. P13V-1 TaxID=2697366 RepID=UPI00187B3748|nr:high-affinity branched-chain amino acid ABC transporter permease LivM [Sneathiella sp. P13V-1]MBE7635661.1 high-affinity branched-chain amino acid ABC transporter permease LivM [Sneathiella sp. P13V-1]
MSGSATQTGGAGGLNPAHLLKDLVVTAFLAAAIFGTTLGFQTVTASGGLSIETDAMLGLGAVALVVVVRLILWVTIWRKPVNERQPLISDGLKASVTTSLAPVGKFFLPTMLLLALVWPFLPTTDRYLLDLSILILTYVMLGWGLNIVVGLAGLLDLGYVAFYAVGAYSYALLAHYFGLSFWLCLPLAGILAAFWGIILGFPVLRLRGDYLAIVTLAFGEIIRVVLLNWYEFTGGPDGLSGIPRPTFFGLEFKRFGEGTFADFFGLEFSSMHRIIFLYFLILILALVTNVVTNRLRRLPIGRAWEALREDEIACRSLGLNTTLVKLSAFSIGAMFAGFAGSFFATRQGFISPESFTFIESALILAIVVLGGMGSQIGVVIASIFLIGGFEVFREAEQFRMLIFGLAMVVIMVWRPRGLISSRDPSVFLKKKKGVSADMVAQGEGH